MAMAVKALETRINRTVTRLKETLITLKALYETGVDAMRFDGLLDEALLNLQDEFESILQQIKHQNIGEATKEEPEIVVHDHGTEIEVKEPQKLFKLLDLFDSLEKLKPEFSKVFEGEAGEDISPRFREPEKLLVHASSKVFWEYEFQIEGNSDRFPPPQDGPVPKLVRYAINYLKYLTMDTYSDPMAKVFRTEQIWKAGKLSKPETYENLLKDAMTNIVEVLQRNVESKRSRNKNKVLSHVFAMNTYWYIYMRSRNSELGKLLGDQYIKKKCKNVAEESAFMYQMQAWGPLVRLIEEEDEELERQNKVATVATVSDNFKEWKMFIHFLNSFSTSR
ncbi:hypothetical protein SLEP1_g21743 [Rubroshorea leprosula]|uniref:Exocyst subunit Exo70 family protein n=1 Tax=Rubroshorea leprosula TaxID=152421 RepID=A0AAV5JG98_9ROSI|nr:hypothetical protein SLEP1_g21743 [Rubroshorea leprosula]